MIRLPVSERGFALALIGSAAIHAAVILSFASGSAPRQVPPIRESCIKAFLVSGHLATVGKPAALPGRKRRESVRTAPVAVAPLRAIPEHVLPVGKEGQNLLADIQPSTERLEKGHDAGGLPAAASPAAPDFIPGGGGLSGSNGAGISAVGQAKGECSGGNGAGDQASRSKETGNNIQAGGGAGPSKDADAVPRYGDNASPAYPPLARLRGYQGVVVLFVEVLVDGRVGRASIRRSAGHGILDRAAMEAVRMWRFEPGRREGRAVTMSVEVPVRFVLNGNPV
jgi:TonB family protein